MDFWDVLLIFHLLAMAFFIGGQLVLAAVLVPVMKGREEMRVLARRFAAGSAVAIVVLVLTGSMIASNENLWGNGWLHAKLTLLIAVVGLIVYHVQNGEKRWVDPILAVLSLSIVVCAVGLAG